MLELDHLHIELSGTNLIEASAGTGKTYAIACLYLRLLIERELTPEQILVVTYTEAATKELRGRIRTRIREALSVLDGAANDDHFLIGLCEHAESLNAGRGRARELLDRALTSFDTAAIFTIHGFCLRALQDNAFESGSLYDTELVTDQTALVREIVDDFWRIRFFSESAPLLGYALRNGFTCDYLMSFLREIWAHPRLKVIPWFETSAIAIIEKDCLSAYGMLKEYWKEAGSEIRELVATDKGLGRAADTYRQDLLPPLFAAMDAFVAGDNPYDLFADFDKFCSGWMEKKKLKKYSPPRHGFFDCCQVLQDTVRTRFLALRVELIHFCRERLPLRKRERNIRFFDDLLGDLYLGLNSENGPLFTATLREKYRAALIDEFQDTDPVQYDIFRKIYSTGSCPLFLIGDPKQAIYSFRGADIFAYMQAARNVPREKRFTLTANWRSTPRLLTAFNSVFDNIRQPFVYDRISYHPLSSGRADAGKKLTIAGSDSSGLHLWYMPADYDGTPINVGRANQRVPQAVAAEIARLLRQGAEGTALIGDRALAPRDMAVIVRSHRQAGLIQDALRALDIPSVMRSDMSIFATDEARQVFALLRALADPGNETQVRAALVTDILGRSGNDIAAINEDETAWEHCLESFREYHHTWLERGFMVMSQFLMAREGVRGRLLRHPDGERRLTNLLHCFDLIHHKALEVGLGMEGLITWFGERIAANDSAEEYQIRLETDEMAVKIVTIHVSKGLEYPVVFCPFLWGGVRGNDEVVAFHEDDTMVKDFGSPDYDRHRTLAQKETLAENLRLLYVALTRAQYCCYLCAGKINDRTRKNRPETSPLSYLFHASAETRTADDLVGALASEVSDLDQVQVVNQLRDFAGLSDENISVSPLPETVAVVPDFTWSVQGSVPVCRAFAGRVSGDWRVASFTSFSAHGKTAIEQPDRDEIGEQLTIAAEPDGLPTGRSIFSFPRGAQAGIFLHGIFETLDFYRPDPDLITSQVTEGLEKYGYDAEWLPHVRSMVSAVITTPLASPEGAFTLSGLERGSWLSELEFFFPLNFLTPEHLGSCLLKWGAQHSVADLGRISSGLDFKPVRGMVRGFMDMVFHRGGRYYLVDWKSNHLGYRLEDYGREALTTAMERNLYPLQYLLYTVALNRYLSLRVPAYDYESHFGGVLYVFLRGASPEHGEQFGFFRDLPSRELIDDLTDCLVQAGG
ncbi:MAG: exodeoxyribonuclease V subunit beta [Desulfuromonadales bacterium]|nr:exodeoxyribonuclease V subunit beta [Desulfuromonadales bacterium]